MLKHYLIDATSLSSKEASRLEQFLEGYAFLVNSTPSGMYEVVLEEHQSLEVLPQIPASCKITHLQKS